MDAAAAALAEQLVLRQAQHERQSSLLPGMDRSLVGWAVPTVPGPCSCSGLLIAVGDRQPFRLLSPLITHHSSPVTQEAQPPLLPLPDKPSIVVLPFVNMSEDPKQDYFSDGITEDLTTDLAKISSLFVIARNSAFTYKGKAVKVQDVSREMGVQYILEGSVRRTRPRTAHHGAVH